MHVCVLCYSIISLLIIKNIYPCMQYNVLLIFQNFFVRWKVLVLFDSCCKCPTFFFFPSFRNCAPVRVSLFPFVPPSSPSFPLQLEAFILLAIFEPAGDSYTVRTLQYSTSIAILKMWLSSNIRLKSQYSITESTLLSNTKMYFRCSLPNEYIQIFDVLFESLAFMISYNVKILTIQYDMHFSQKDC